MSTQPSRLTVSALVWGVVVPALLWAVVLAGMLFVVPRYEHIFRDFNLELPTPTKVVLGVDHWIGNYWYVLILWFPFFLGLGIAVLALLRLRPNWSALSRLWCLLLAALPVLTLAVVAISVYLPWMKLQEALSR